MLKIEFDTEAVKTRAIEGPFASREALEAACINASPDDAAYRAWALKHDVDPQSGSIITTAYNPDLLERRYAALSAQLDDFIGAKQGLATTSGLSYAVPANLIGAVKAEAEKWPHEAVEILMLSTTRENPHFDLLKMFPQLQIGTMVAAPNEEYADRCNRLIAEKAPELSETLIYESNWQKNPMAFFDLAAVNPALHYYDEAGLEKMINDIANEHPEHVVFSNLMPNDDPNGAAQWKTQRYNGGVIPLFIPARGALTALMQEAGYTLETEAKAPVGFDLSKGSSFAAQNPVLDNFSYVLRP